MKEPLYFDSEAEYRRQTKELARTTPGMAEFGAETGLERVARFRAGLDSYLMRPGLSMLEGDTYTAGDTMTFTTGDTPFLSTGTNGGFIFRRRNS